MRSVTSESWRRRAGAAGALARRGRRLGLLLGLAGLLAGCATAGHLAQAVQGHLALVWAARPVEAWLADPATPPPLRERLVRSQRMRDFASATLALPDNASYRRYAALDRPAAVWNVVAAPALSLELKTWCYPVAGCVGYRGFFDRAAADREAAQLAAAGWEVAVLPVPAYSTLGRLPGAWLADPLLSTFLGGPEADVARLIFHELAHQRLYLAGDTAFNESYATAVEQLGVARWLAAEASPAERAQDAEQEARRQAFRERMARHRAALEAVYADTTRPEAERQARKAEAYAALREDHARWRAGEGAGDARFDAWIAAANNARLGLQSAYRVWVPAFEALFRREGGDFRRFHAAVEALAALPPDRRNATLRGLLPPALAATAPAAP